MQWLKHSRLAQLVAQVSIVLGVLDASGVIPLLGPKVGAVVAVVGGLVAGYNRAIGRDDDTSIPTGAR